MLAEGSSCLGGFVCTFEESAGGCCLCPGTQGLSQPCPAPAGCTHLGLDAPEGLLQQQGEAAHLPLEPVVVVGEGP